MSSSTGRRYLDWIHVEISLALDRRVSRYALWLALWDQGGDPDQLSRDEARRFVEAGLTPFLESQNASLNSRAQRRLAGRILRFNPRFPTPEEWLAGPRPGHPPTLPSRSVPPHSSP